MSLEDYKVKKESQVKRVSTTSTYRHHRQATGFGLFHLFFVCLSAS